MLSISTCVKFFLFGKELKTLMGTAFEHIVGKVEKGNSQFFLLFQHGFLAVQGQILSCMLYCFDCLQYAINFRLFRILLNG